MLAVELEREIYSLIAALFKLLGLVPRTWATKLATSLGHTLFLVDKKHRQIALNNLTHAFGNEKSPCEIRMLAKQVFRNLVQILFEIGWSLSLERKDFNKYFTIEGLSNLRKAYEKHKGVLILTAHMGNWELLTVIAAMTGYPTRTFGRVLQ
jgi:KDO2-lipid IV(A) lauroyltransferase